MNNSFPSSTLTALAYLYVEKNAQAGMSPAELYDMYQKAFKELRETEAKQKDLQHQTFA